MVLISMGGFTKCIKHMLDDKVVIFCIVKKYVSVTSK